MPVLRRFLPALTVVLVAAGLAGCTDSGTPAPTVAAPANELTLALTGRLGPLDPQQIGSEDVAAFAGRTLFRTLTAYAPTPDASGRARLVGDLATDTGRPDATGRVWTFTLRDGVQWDDGSAVTCTDVAYGVSRTFVDGLAAGAGYPRTYLDLPRNADGTTTYAGPYAATTDKTAKDAAAAYAKAVACDKSDTVITFTLSQPVADFGAMVSTLEFAPYPKRRDPGLGATPISFSDGPYRVSGTWTGTGGTLDRNPHWSAATDQLRLTKVAKIVVAEGRSLSGITQEILTKAPVGRHTIAWDPAVPALQGDLAKAEVTTVNPATGVVDYLAPNFRSRVFGNRDARTALALATDRAAYVAALGGDRSAEITNSLLTRPVPGFHGTDVLGVGPSGNPAAAASLLTKAGFTAPVPITLAYRSGPTADRAIAALKTGWERAGFAVTLHPVGDDYLASIAAPDAAGIDLFWADWAPDFPVASTVLPPLFDSRINLGVGGAGRDYGRFEDAKANLRIDQLTATLDPAAAAIGWAAFDKNLLGQAVYIPLAEHKAVFYAGVGVTGQFADDILGGVLDLADVGVK